MWVFLSEGFLSIVNHDDYDGVLLVRARDPDHITDVFESARLYEDHSADYPFRADIPAAEVARVLSHRVENIDYRNFKNSITNGHFAETAGKVWTVLWRMYHHLRRFW